MEAACWRTAENLRFRPQCIPQAVTIMVMALVLHTKDPDGVGDALNTFLLPDLFPSSGLEAALLMRKWDTILGGGTSTFFADTSLLMGQQKVTSIIGWYKSASQLEAWTVFCTVFLGYYGVHPATYEMFFLLEEISGVSPRLRAQSLQKPTFPSALLCLVNQEFNKRFCQALERRHRVWWPNF